MTSNATVSYCFVSVAMGKVPPGLISRVTALETLPRSIGWSDMHLAVVYGCDWELELSMLHVLHARTSISAEGASFTPSHPFCCAVPT